MAENAGGIYYDIEMDVQGLLVAQQRVNQRLDLMERGFDSTTRAVNNTERSMSSLSGVAVALAAALSAKQISEYADAWATVNNKLANSLRPNEQLADVTERVFNITQQTRSSLDATASLYARLERATRQYGTSADDLAKLTTIINQGFVVSGATAQEAENAIIQLSQGLASGALRGEEFNSVNEQGNRLIVALADSMGVSIGEMRNMAAQGKLTTDVVVNGLLSQGAVIGKEFANTTTTISQALQVAGNNVTKFFGENSTVKTGAAIFNDAVVTASENIDVLSAALTAAAAIMGSRYVGALTMSAASQIQSALAAQRQATANAQAAQSALIAATSVKRKAVADKEAALSSLALAQAEYNVAKGSAAEMLALDALIAAKSRASAASLSLAQAETAQAAASARAAAAASAASVGIGLARGALSLIGGPGGAAMLAASAIFYFWQKAQQAREEALRFADSLDKVNASMKAMNNTQLRGTIADANESIRAQKDEISDLQAEVDSLSSRYRNFTPEAQAVAESLGQGADFAHQQAEVSDRLAKKSRDLANAQDKLAQTQETAAEANRTLTNNMLTSMGVHDGLIQKGWSLEQVQSAVAKAFGNTADEINRANQAGQNFNPKALQVSPPTADGDKVILNLEEQNELLKIQDERQRAVTKARMQAAKVTDNPNQISRAGDLAGENYDLQKAEEARQEAQRKGEQQDKRSASAADSVAQKLDKLRAAQNLSTESVEKRRIQEAGLRAEQSLGSGATQKQLEEARALGEANERAAISIQKRKEAEQGQKYAKQEIASAQTTVDPSTGQAVDPLAQINLQEKQKLDALAKYQEIDKQNTKLYEDAKTAIMQQASYQRQAILLQEQQTYQQNVSSLLGESSNFAGSLADAIGQAAGKSSAAYQALFAISKGFAIAQASLNLQTAISNAMAIPWPANIPAIAQALSAGTQIVSAISGINYSGGRKNGGSVSPGNVYPVGEGNLPELMQTSKGLFMIPGDGGKVFSNKDVTSGAPSIKKASTGSEYLSNSSSNSAPSNAGGGSGMQVNIQFFDQASGGNRTLQAEASIANGIAEIKAYLLDDQANNGVITQGYAAAMGQRVVARGAY
ncbi:tail length tape measure protein [Klebsiella pneumoniae]|uniref:tape measure protein n=1 Tax=Klebsiella pneumoniae TaxID=573 RepID=UPI0009BA6307|nr:tape measure protein [Klebsiella pneumoniae]ARB15629.1 tail length tape-measure protein 1 [Klebsiella phage 2b LV-2017]SLS11477.1 tail length tape measure protein [Klebsiella pneumoniae]SLS31288.1 tail length tape measure protein [Klebsiella pneumoniae]SLS34743.1 tail length tape measure protein [Klebsiella pneumoniae]SLS60889.1 tail length tape measure protein [Klebsiella pneumoniae]